MIYRFVNDPDLNLNFDDDTLYTPLRHPVAIEDRINIASNKTSNKTNTNVSDVQKPVSEKSKNVSLFTWFVIVAIILLCLWYAYGNGRSSAPINPTDKNVQSYSPDYGTHMKYGIF